MRPSDKKHEYIRVEFKDDVELMEILNSYGSSGWQPIFTKKFAGIEYMILEREILP